MKKVLFVGIGKFSMRDILKELPADKLESINGFLVFNPKEAITTVKENPDMSVVIFIGHLVIDSNEDHFRINVGVAIDLKKILASGVVMIAATPHQATNVELFKNGCQVMTQKQDIIKWLQKNI